MSYPEAPPRRQRAFRQRLGKADSYGLVLLFAVVSFLVTAALSGHATGRVLVVFLQGSALMFAVRTSRASRLTAWTAAFLWAGAMVATALAAEGTQSGVAFSLSGLLVALAFGTIVFRLAARPAITAETLMGALSVYVLLGLGFVYLYAAIGSFSGEPFFTTQAEASLADYQYFAFATLTTVGYGDLTAAGDVPRALAVLEALLGQLYLVSVVASVVANLGGRRGEQVGGLTPDPPRPQGDGGGRG
jgi:hypothetical protein